MTQEKNFFGALITYWLLIFACGNEVLSNKCNFSQRHQILTCVDLDLNNSDVGNFIKEDTHVLIIKGSNNLKIPSDYHNNKNFLHITSYQLVDNNGIEINSLAFKELENLRYLKISNNQKWSVLQSNTFSGLHGLETLTIANNNIGILENDAFEDLSDLDVLELTNNKFTILQSSIFEPLKSVTSLFLYRNNIETLESECLEGLVELQLLDLTHNNLKQINTVIFSKLNKLTDLYLSFNEIEVIEGKFTLANLKFLYLQHNKLKILSEDLFNSSPNLKAIDLSYNEITFISDNTFYNLGVLDHINLAHNLATAFDNLKYNDENKPLVVV